MTDTTPIKVPSGSFTDAPRMFTVTRHGAVLLRAEDGTGCWRGDNGSPLLPDVTAARAVLRGFGYTLCTDTNTIRPTNPESGAPATVAVQAAPPPVPTPPPARLSTPTLEVEQEAPIRMLANALPCTANGDQIDVNRLALASAAWAWMVENRSLLAPFLAPPIYKGGPAQSLYVRPKGRR